MAKREQLTTGSTSRTPATDASKGDAFEEQVVAFATQLGRIVGSVQAKAEGWLDREALSQQIASVRDGAADLLKHMGGGARKASKKTKVDAAARGRRTGRSGGVVDAPGKKHRKPLESRSTETRAKSQAEKVRTAKPRVKTNRLRGRG